jgi:hypothetical protein
MDKLKKAADWLHKKTNYNYTPVVANRRGYAEFVAYIFRIHRDNKPDIRFVMTVHDQQITGIKRFCVVH